MIRTFKTIYETNNWEQEAITEILYNKEGSAVVSISMQSCSGWIALYPKGDGIFETLLGVEYGKVLMSVRPNHIYNHLCLTKHAGSAYFKLEEIE